MRKLLPVLVLALAPTFVGAKCVNDPKFVSDLSQFTHDQLTCVFAEFEADTPAGQLVAKCGLANIGDAAAIIEDLFRLYTARKNAAKAAASPSSSASAATSSSAKCADPKKAGC